MYSTQIMASASASAPHHGPAGSGRTEHQQIMTASRRDGHSTLGHLLPTDVGEINIINSEFVKPFIESRRRWLDLQFACEEGHRFGKRRDADHFDALDDGCLSSARLGNNQSFNFIL